LKKGGKFHIFCNFALASTLTKAYLDAFPDIHSSMRLKHYLYIATLFCALAEIGMALYAVHWGSILKEIALVEHRQPDSELIVVKALNIALPLGLCCLGMLVYTWRVDSIGGFAFFLAVVMHMIGLDLNVRAVKQVYGTGTPLASVTWWAPADDSWATKFLKAGPAS
jgi:hypothetical protein